MGCRYKGPVNTKEKKNPNETKAKYQAKAEARVQYEATEARGAGRGVEMKGGAAEPAEEKDEELDDIGELI